MDQTTYTDEEIRKVLQALFIEKKRVKELTQKVKDLETETLTLRNGSDETPKVVTVMSLNDPKLEKMLDTLIQGKHQENAPDYAKQLKQALLQYQQEMPKLKEDNLKLKKIVVAMKKKLEKPTATNDQALQDQVKRLSQELQAAQEQFKTYQEKLSARAEECAQLRRSLDSLQSSNITLSREVEKSRQFKADADRLSREMEQMAKQAPATEGGDKALADAKKELQATKDELQAATGARDAAKEVQQKLEQDLAATKAQLDRATSDLTTLSHSVSQEQNHNEGEIQQIIEEKLQMSKDLENLRAEFTRNRTKFEETKGLLAAAQDASKRTKQQNDKLVERLQAYETQVKELQEFEYSYKKQGEQKLQLEQAVQNDKRFIQSLQQQKASLSAELNQAREKITELSLAYESAQNSTSHTQEKLSAVEHEKARWEADNTQLRQQVEAKNAELEQVRAALHDLENFSGQSSEELAKQKSAVHQFSEELNLIKQALVRGVREAKELEMRFMEMVSEKVAAVTKSQHADKLQQQQADEIRELKLQLTDAQTTKRQLQTRLDDLHLSIDAANAHKATLQGRIEKLESEAETFAKTRNTLQDELAERDYRIETLQQSLEQAEATIAGFEAEKDQDKARLDQAELAMQILEKEKKDLEAVTEDQRRKESSLHAQLAEAQREVEEAQAEKERLTQQQEEYRRVIEGQRGQVEALEQQVTELQIRTSEMNQIQHDNQEITDKYDQLREEFLEAKAQAEEAMDARTELEKTMESLRSIHEEDLHKQDTQNQQIVLANAEVGSLNQKVADLNSELEEREERIRSAQQHLAKKVKENALLMEKQEESRMENVELQNQIRGLESKIEEQKDNLELQRQQEKKLQDLLNESIKSAESQVGKWEKKYFQAYDKWQDAENLNKELNQEIDTLNGKLEQLEQKHRQVTSLLNKLGSFLGGNPLVSAIKVGGDAPQAPTQEELAALTSGFTQDETSDDSLEPQKSIQDLVSAAPTPKPMATQQELFIGGGGSGKPRQNLFD